MNKFQYSMQGILNIKNKLESQEKIEFQNAVNQLNAELEKMDALIERKNDYETELRILMNQKLDLIHIRQNEEAIEIVKGYIKIQKKEVEKAEKQVDIARERLKDIMVERKTHDILKERAFEQYRREYEKWERKEVDESISYKHAKKGEDNL